MEEHLHDHIDRLERVEARSAGQLRETFATLDVVRLADPNDTQFNEALRGRVLEVVGQAMQEAHREGRRLGQQLEGGASPEATPLLARSAAVAELRVDAALGRLHNRVNEYLTDSAIRGLSPDQALATLENSLRSIGDSGVVGNAQLTAELRTLATDVLSDTVSAASQAGIQEHQVGPDIEADPNAAQAQAGQALLRWVCALVNTCPDCVVRHLTVATADEWDAMGRPATGWSVCGGRCKCLLVPVVGTEDVAPLRRVRTTTRGLTARAPRQLGHALPRAPERRLAREASIRENAADSIEARRALGEMGRQNRGGP